MPIEWLPKKTTIEEDIVEELARLEGLEIPRRLFAPEPELPRWEPPEARMPTPTEAPAWMPQQVEAPMSILMPRVAAPAISRPPTVEVPKEKPLKVPFWQRALQVFAAPFVWVEETIIKPGMALMGTTLGFVPEVERLPGEDYWEWKKRSWAKWKPPGINISVPWSDDPLRIDVRGVLELAPWLLIPGAGQVGAGARAARGLAGLAGRLGQAGKVVGYAIEYSPWGMVEKTAGVAMRAGIKALGKGTEAISTRIGRRIFGEIIEPPMPPVVKKLSTFFKETVIPARKEFEKALPALRAKQAGAIEKITKQFREGKISATKYTELVEKATAVGRLKEKFAISTERFTKEEMDDLLGLIVRETEKGFVARDSALALRDLLMTGALPEPHHIAAFARVYGEEFATAVGKFARLPVTTKQQIVDALNLPRAVLASGDLSATFRQGLILCLTRPQAVPKAFWKQFKYFASEKLSLEMDDALRSHSLFNEAVDNGVDFTILRKGARLFAKEEPFASNLAQRIPFVRKSERAFTGFLNEMRMSAYEGAHNAMIAQGATPAQFKLIGKFINLASGRGVMPKNLERYAPALNTVLFSARYQLSTLQMPRQLGRMLLSGNPYMRKQAAQALVTFVGGGVALLALLKNTGVARVETDPRSGDFGKIVIGETRVDIWRGYLQYARFVAQMLMGQSKTAFGNMNKKERSETASRFLQSKLSPAAGLMLDLLKGETYMGEDLITSTGDVVRSFRERMLPLAIQDVIDAMEMSGASGLWTAAPATLGIGILTYVSDFVRVKERIAKQLGYETWDEIDPATQRRLLNSNPELQAASIEFDRQITGIAWGDWRLAAKAIENIFTENVNKAVAQYRETKDGVQFREKITNAWIARRGGYAARQEMPQFEDIVARGKTEDTAEALVGLGPEQLAIRAYTEALFGDDMYDEFGDYRFDEAQIRKEQLRREMGEEMFNYVEMYRDIKYEALPREFHELMRAKEVMRSYWQVREEAIKIYGEPKTEAQLRRLNRFIARVRKRLRATNPEIAKYYEMFYSRGV